VLVTWEAKVAELSELLGVLDLEQVGDGRFRAQNF
jgi:hypothetical protein